MALSQVESGTYDRSDFEAELNAAPLNHLIGGNLLFQNDQVRIFETVLRPGERGAFHIHDETYFWTVVDAGRGLQRYDDGTWIVRDYRVGDTRFLVQSGEKFIIHDLENVGQTSLRFITVELRTQFES